MPEQCVDEFSLFFLTIIDVVIFINSCDHLHHILRYHLLWVLGSKDKKSSFLGYQCRSCSSVTHHSSSSSSSSSHISLTSIAVVMMRSCPVQAATQSW